MNYSPNSFSVTVWLGFGIGGHVNSQYNRFAMLIHDTPIDDASKVGVWCVMSATTITGQFFEIINPHHMAYTFRRFLNPCPY